MIQPTLKHLGVYSDAAERLVLGTALTESNLSALDQRSDGVLGPAYGLYQIEPRTHDDIWDNYLRYRQDTKFRVMELLAPVPALHMQLVTNLGYATAMARMMYLRRPEPLPHDTEGQAAYWKRFYNTRAGKGEPADFVRAWRLAGLPVTK